MSFQDEFPSPAKTPPSEPLANLSETSPESEFLVESSPFSRSASSNLGFSPFGHHLSGQSELQAVKRRRLSFSSGDDPMVFEDESLMSSTLDNAEGSPRQQLSQHGSNDGISDQSSNESFECDPECCEERDFSSTSSINTTNDGDSESDGQSDSSDLISDEKIFGDDLLYENSSVSVEEAVVDLLNVYVKNRLTKTALGDMVKYVGKILPLVNGMPRNLNELFKSVKQRAPPVSETAHVYCPGCFEPKSKRDDQCLTQGCTVEGGNYFYEFPLDQLIKFLFEKGGLAEAVEEFQQSRMAEEGVIRDICDGSEIKKLKETYSGAYDLTLMWNTDGISLDTDYRLWPVLFTFCEIPIRLRPFYVWTSLIWYDKREPPMKVFLQPFVKSLVDICEQGGVSWTHPKSGKQITAHVIAPFAVADAPARSKLQEVKQYNSINGCNMCEITCSSVVVDGRKRYFYEFNENPAQLRSAKRMIKQGQLAQTVANGSVMGVKGISVLYSVPHLDIGKFLFPEYMHSVLLGCVLSFTLLMMNMNVEWRLKKSLKDIDQIMLSLKVPDFLKIPQKLSHVTKFKAHELRAWLLYFSLPILSTFLPEKYLQHWMLLVASICLLLKERISENDLQAADIMLRMFVRNVGKLYAVTAYKYNTHQLLHLVLTVRRWGPLGLVSAFMFENFNGVLSRMVHGTKHIAKELVENLKIATGLMVLKSAAAKNVTLCADVLGHEVKYLFSESELSLIAELNTAPYKTYVRAKVGKTVFTSKDYDDRVKRCNSFVILEKDNNDEVGQILCFVKFSCSDEIWCLVDVYPVDNTRFFVHQATRFVVNHVIPLKETNRERTFVSIAKLKQKVIKVLDFVCIPLNTYEIKL